MAKNTGIPYEKITRNIFQAIMNENSVNTINVQQDVSLQSIIAPKVKHQVDVYWEFQQGGIIYRNILLCKDWKTKVKKEAIMALQKTLEDVAGQPRGIYVSASGFQRSAKEWAKANGIILYELRPPIEGEVDDFRFELSLLQPVIDDVNVDPDLEWITNECIKIGINEDAIYQRFQSNPLELDFYNEEGEKSISWGDILDGCINNLTVAVPSFRIIYPFTEPTFLRLPYLPIRIKVDRLDIKMHVNEKVAKFNFSGQALVQYILKNVLEENYRKIGHEHKPIYY